MPVKRTGPIVMAVLLLLLWQTAQSGVYRWTDENGKVHFGDRPPQEQETEQVAVPTGGSQGGAQEGAEEESSPAPSNAERQETRQRLLDQYARERDEKRQAAEQKKKEQAQRQQNCILAKDNLRGLEEHGRIYNLLPNGERYYLTAEEREQTLAKARAEVKRWCD